MHPLLPGFEVMGGIIISWLEGALSVKCLAKDHRRSRYRDSTRCWKCKKFGRISSSCKLPLLGAWPSLSRGKSSLHCSQPPYRSIPLLTLTCEHPEAFPSNPAQVKALPVRLPWSVVVLLVVLCLMRRCRLGGEFTPLDLLDGAIYNIPYFKNPNQSHY
jgi:hypothetical protein